MNVYDYRTIFPEESSYHARTSHGSQDTSEYGDGDIPPVDHTQNSSLDEPDSSDFGAKSSPKDIIPDEVPRRDGPGGN